MKRLTALLALVAGLALTTTESVSAQDYYYTYQPAYSYVQPAPYAAPPTQELLLEEYIISPLIILQPVRNTAADATNLYMDLSPGAQIAEGLGLIDRGSLLGFLRGF